MSGDMAEAMGDVVTGSLVARAADPAAKAHGVGDGHAPALCLNCGTRLIGAHCHSCGQSAHVHRSMGAIVHELAHGVLHFEGKIWRTLPLLVFRPGELTRRYIAGERVRFVAPMALFLFTVFLMFASISAVAGGFGTDDAPARKARVTAATREAAEKTQAELTRVDTARTEAALKGLPTAELDQEAEVLRATLRGFEMTDRTGGFSDFHSGWKSLDKGVDKAAKDPALLIYKMQTSAYKFSWALIPLSTPFVAMLFLWRRRFGLYDHAVFVTYSLSFTMLLAIVLTLAGALGAGGWLAWPALLGPPVHMFVQLRGAYGLRRRSALWRTVVLLVFAFVVLLGFAAALLLKGLTG